MIIDTVKALSLKYISPDDDADNPFLYLVRIAITIPSSPILELRLLLVMLLQDLAHIARNRTPIIETGSQHTNIPPFVFSTLWSDWHLNNNSME